MNEHYPFQKMSLPFDYASLVPHCDPDTLYLHYSQIYCRYVDMLNYHLAPHSDYLTWSLEQLIQDKLNIPITASNNIKNCAGAVYAHELYFDSISSNPSQLSGPLARQINETYGSVSNFESLVKQAAFSIPGSGWVWLVTENGDDLHIVITQNNEAPPSTLGHILVLDMWEHAYYLIYPAKLGEYIDNLLQVIDWDKAQQRYSAFQNMH